MIPYCRDPFTQLVKIDPFLLSKIVQQQLPESNDLWGKMVKPTLVFVPGFWEGPSVFSTITKVIESEYDYPTKTLSLASTGTAPPHPKTFLDDCKGVAAAIEQLADEDKEMVLVMHSAGSFTGSQAVKGIGVKKRKSEGKAGGVRKLVFLTGACFPEGTEHPNQPFFLYEVSTVDIRPLDSLVEAGKY